MRVLVVEDYGPIRGAVVTALRDEGWNVELAADGTDAFTRIQGETPYDLVVLDLMIPGMDGLTVLRSMRDKGIDSHVLILTARDAIESRVQALDLGADDYLTKPFAMEELVARSRALLRRHYAKKSPVIQVGPLSVRTSDHRVTLHDQPIELTAREYTLLEYMMFRAGDLVRRDELHTDLYGDADGTASSNVVDVYVGYLRKKLEADGTPRLLHTRRGEGYILEFREGGDSGAQSLGAQNAEAQNSGAKGQELA
ncbi:Response regulator MprA [Planctomycetes bacterium Poly30]|uniref:Response regulator MprA n=1 Tax=Saltatorellus ferox TaxID=2528018 RepID=A0A518ELI3_9BACT|nr:Response regulator MprA [Planctomycetes bacterium Poly30]